MINYVFEDCPTVPKFKPLIGTVFRGTFLFCRLSQDNMLNILVLAQLAGTLGTVFWDKGYEAVSSWGRTQERNTLTPHAWKRVLLDLKRPGRSV